MGSGPKHKAASTDLKPASRAITEPRSIFDASFDTAVAVPARRAPVIGKAPARTRPDSKSAQSIWGSMLE